MVPIRPFGTHFALPVKTNQIIPTALAPFERDMFLGPFEEVFDEILNGFFQNPQKTKDIVKNKNLYPKTDAILKDDEIVFNLAIPGLKKEDIQIEFEAKQNDLLVKYEKEEKKEEKEEDKQTTYFMKELKHSSFFRIFHIPEELTDINGERKISSKLEDGILSIFIPIKSVKKEKEEKGAIRIEIE